MTTETIDMAASLLPVPKPTFHFLVTNVFEWRADTDLHTLMKEMDKHKQTYWVWYVPVTKDTPYEIEFYRPQVERAFVLAKVEYANGKRVK